MIAVLFVIAFLITGGLIEWLGPGDAHTSPQYEFTWVDWMFLIAICVTVGTAFAVVVVRVKDWEQRRSEAAATTDAARRRDEAARNERVLQGIDHPRPADLAKMSVLSIAGPWMERMPEVVHLTTDGHQGDPVHYIRADVAERIERGCYSRPGFFWVGAGEVSQDLFRAAETACGGTKPAVEWFNQYMSQIEGTPTDFLNRGGSAEALKRLLLLVADKVVPPDAE